MKDHGRELTALLESAAAAETPEARKDFVRAAFSLGVRATVDSLVAVPELLTLEAFLLAREEGR